jgi:hypothetical protein
MSKNTEKKSKVNAKTWKDGDLVSTHRYIRAINCADLNPSARRAGIALAGAFGLKRAGLVVASTRYLTVICNFGGRSTAQEALKELAAEGWITPAGKVTKTNAYELIFTKAEEVLDELGARLRARFLDEEASAMDCSPIIHDNDNDDATDLSAVPNGPVTGLSRADQRSVAGRSAVPYEAYKRSNQRNQSNEAALRDPADDPCLENSNRMSKSEPINNVQSEQRKSDGPPEDQIWKRFNEFWNAFPRKLEKNKEETYKEFRLIALSGGVTSTEIMEGLSMYKESVSVPRYVVSPLKWLKERRWEEFAAMRRQAVRGKKVVAI